jgi:DNA helicase HerA-like ATPase
MKAYSVEPKIWRSGRLVFGDPDDRQQSYVGLGHLAEAGPKTEVSFDVTGERVVAIFGKRGSGKSYTLGVLLEGLCAAQPNAIATIQEPRAVLLLDTLNVFWSLLYPFRDGETLPDRVKGAEDAKRYGLGQVATQVQVFVPKGTSASTGDFQTFSIGYGQLDAEDWAALLDLDLYTERPAQSCGRRLALCRR